MPAFVRFLRDLFELGQVALPVSDQGDEPDFASRVAMDVLRDRDRAVRLSLAGTSPDLVEDAALEGAAWLYQGCQVFIERSRTTEALSAAFECGVDRWPPDPQLVYSLDLALSFLPDLHRHARQHAEGDPLMETLNQLALAWPLSSVGIPDLEPAWERVAPWWDDFSLRQLYVDRILARDDGERLRHGAVAEQVRACLGIQVEALAGASVGQALWQ